MATIEVPSSSSALLEAVRRRDPEAWRRLAEIYGPLVFQWGRRAGLQPADAADVLQQVFISVSASISAAQWGRPGDSFRGWLWTIFHSRLMDFFREQRRQPIAMDDDDLAKALGPTMSLTPELSSLQGNQDTAALVRRALGVIQRDFTEATWLAFRRSVLDGHPTSEIARDLGLTPAAVCMCRARVLRRLRETLAGLGICPDWFD